MLIMKKKISYLIVGLTLLSVGACKDELAEVTNKNEPTAAALGTEAGLISFAKGGTYMNGIGTYYASIDDQLGPRIGKNLGYFTTIVYGLHEAMGDVVFVPWGNQNFKFANNPTDITLDDNTNVPMPIGSTQPFELRLRNDRAYGQGNTFLMEWTEMYFLNNAMNVLLSRIDDAAFQGDAETKKNTLKAWAYWWKGYAYSRIGSMYVAGVINDEPNVTNNNFVSNTAMIDEANKTFDKAAAALGSVADVAVYNDVLSVTIPGYCQTGKGGIPSPDAWIRNINTMKARNILVNTRVTDLTAADLTTIQSLTTAGIQENDPVFVVKTTPDFNRSVIDPNFGNVAAYTATENGSTYYISERLIQDFRPGDDRMANNFSKMVSPIVNLRGRGLGYGTRWYLADGGNGVGDAITYVHTGEYGVDDTYLAGSYEENQLMLAETQIRSGNVGAGTAIIDEIRSSQGANLPAIGAVSAEQALEELRSERRIALLFRGLAFYDARRLGITEDKSKGGGRSGAVILSTDDSGAMVVNTNATINYNYLSYFDVPKNELEFNAPAEGSSAVTGPE
jgi:hypothetical protein